MLALCRIRLHHVYMDRRYLTVNDLSTYLGIKPKTLYARVKEIPHYKVGRLIRFKREDVDTWMEQHKVAKSEVQDQKQGQENATAATEPALEPPRARRSRKIRGDITDIRMMARNTIDQVTAEYYSSGHGKSDQVKGSGKEV